MNYAGGFGTLRSATYTAIVSVESMLESKVLEMDSNARAELKLLLVYLEGVMERADAIANSDSGAASNNETEGKKV